MDLRIAIRVADERDYRHLLTTLRLANQRSGNIRLLEVPFPEADVVILRRGEPGSAPLLRACESANHPVPVIYATSNNESSAWVLRWPARTTDLIPLAEAIGRHLHAQQGDRTAPQPATGQGAS